MNAVVHTWFAAVSALALLMSPAQVLAAAPAPGSLLVAPTRVVFEGRERSATISLVNTGAAPATYRISFVEMQMGEKGEMQELGASSDGRPVASMVRYSPRQVTLAPGVAQTVRLQLRKPADLPEGEYRSHLVFRAVPQVPEQDAAAQKKLSVTLTAVYGLAIPVIARHGALSVDTSLSELRLSPASNGNASSLAVRINRSGTRSIHGDLEATWLTPDGRRVQLAQAKGIAVYASNPTRFVRLPVPPAVGPVKDGQVLLTFTEPGGAQIAQAELPLH